MKTKSIGTEVPSAYSRISQEAVFVSAPHRAAPNVKWGWRPVGPGSPGGRGAHRRVRPQHAGQRDCQAQEKLFPPELHRTPRSLSVAMARSDSKGSTFDATSLLQWILENPAQACALAGVPIKQAAPAVKTKRPALPQAFKNVRPQASTRVDTVHNCTHVIWGWDQWNALAPLVAAHVAKRGSVSLPEALFKAQRRVLPEPLQRSLKSLRNLGRTGQVDALSLLQFIIAQPARAQALGTPPAPPPQVVQAQQPPPRPLPPSEPPLPPAAPPALSLPPSSALDSFLAAPIGTLLPTGAQPLHRCRARRGARRGA